MQAPAISASLSSTSGVIDCTAMHGFVHASWGSEPGLSGTQLHAYPAHTLSTEPSPQLLYLFNSITIMLTVHDLVVFTTFALYRDHLLSVPSPQTEQQLLHCTTIIVSPPSHHPKRSSSPLKQCLSASLPLNTTSPFVPALVLHSTPCLPDLVCPKSE